MSTRLMAQSLCSRVLKKAESLGHAIFYVAIYLTGQRGAYSLLGLVVFVYVAASRRIHSLTRPYISRRFPDHGPLRRWVDTFRIVLSFGQVLVDRAWLGIKKGRVSLDETLVGREELFQAVSQKKGAILLTAHVGNWQAALARLPSLPVKVNVLMRYEEESAAKHYFEFDNKPLPFQIIKNDGFMGGVIEAANALQRGEAVTIMGDRYIRGPYARVSFLGSETKFPIAAYQLAAVAGAPVIVLLAAKTGIRSYEMKVWDIFYPSEADREKREEQLTYCACRFARTLEEYLKKHPYQWYNFYDFWSE